jgi:hypothetical protein
MRYTRKLRRKTMLKSVLGRGMRSSIRDGLPPILTCGDRDDYRITHRISGALKSGHSFDDRKRRPHYIYSGPHPAILNKRD